MTDCLDADQYTTYIHMEADMAIPWSALTPWAEDTALLAEHGFHRGFFVIEFSVQEGEAVMVNEIQPVGLSSKLLINALNALEAAQAFTPAYQMPPT